MRDLTASKSVGLATRSGLRMANVSSSSALTVIFWSLSLLLVVQNDRRREEWRDLFRALLTSPCDIARRVNRFLQCIFRRLPSEKENTSDLGFSAQS